MAWPEVFNNLCDYLSVLYVDLFALLDVSDLVAALRQAQHALSSWSEATLLSWIARVDMDSVSDGVQVGHWLMTAVLPYPLLIYLMLVLWVRAPPRHSPPRHPHLSHDPPVPTDCTLLRL